MVVAEAVAIAPMGRFVCPEHATFLARRPAKTMDIALERMRPAKESAPACLGGQVFRANRLFVTALVLEASHA